MELGKKGETERCTSYTIHVKTQQVFCSLSYGVQYNEKVPDCFSMKHTIVGKSSSLTYEGLPLALTNFICETKLAVKVRFLSLFKPQLSSLYRFFS